MRKLLFTLVLALALTSCSHRSPITAREWTIKLRDSIGTVHITLPLVYDTIHSWRCDDDYSGGGQYYHRIQSSMSCMIEEGCFGRYISDTIYSFTVSQAAQPQGRPIEPFDAHKHLLRRVEDANRFLYKHLEMSTEIDTASFLIDGLNYSLVWLPEHTTSKKKTNNQIHITTIFNHRLISFTFEKTSSIPKDTAFIKESIEALKTIRFEK